MSEIGFDKNVAVITGAGQGLGKAYALMMARRGANIVVNDIQQHASTEVVEKIRENGGIAIENNRDISNYQQARSLVEESYERFGRIDIVVNNAGFLLDKTFLKMPIEHFEKITDIHLLGSAYVTHAAWPIMMEQNYGRVVYTSSAAGLWGNFGQSNYSAAKMAVIGLMHSLKLEGEKHNIRTNTIAPLAMTRLSEGVFPEPLQEQLKPEHVAALVCYLCSRQCSLSGEIFEVGAGKVSRVVTQRNEGLKFDTLSPEAVAEKIPELIRQPANNHYQSAVEAAKCFFK